MIKKNYEFNRSPFYRIYTKKKLAALLNITLAELKSVIDKTTYNLHSIKDREIQQPIGKLKIVHKRIFVILSRIKLPAYVHSTKNHSYITNAAAHQLNTPLVKTDISSFYPSTGFSKINQLFKNDFECAEDVAWILAVICTYNRQYLPTGSHLSSILAFLTHKKMFDEIYELSLNNNCVMTCYVDDISISGEKASKKLLYEAIKIIRKHGLNAKPSKSKTFSKDQAKIVTGVALTNQGLRVPNKRLQSTCEIRRILPKEENIIERDRLERILLGKLLEEKQIHKAVLNLTH